MLTRERIRKIASDGLYLREKFFFENEEQLLIAAGTIANAFSLYKKKVLIFGNGGSASDAQHMAAEFIGRFKTDREGFPAIALTCDSSAVTAIGNDYGFPHIFGRQVRALGVPGDIAIGISTSGKSLNVSNGICEALNRQLIPIALTGPDGMSGLEGASILQIKAPSRETARIQELHIAAIHTIAELVDMDLGICK